MLWVGDTTKGLSHRDPWTEKGLINLMPNILGNHTRQFMEIEVQSHGKNVHSVLKIIFPGRSLVDTLPK